jgi:hypothetical protein
MRCTSSFASAAGFLSAADGSVHPPPDSSAPGLPLVMLKYRRYGAEAGHLFIYAPLHTHDYAHTHRHPRTPIEVQILSTGMFCG